MEWLLWYEFIYGELIEIMMLAFCVFAFLTVSNYEP